MYNRILHSNKNEQTFHSGLHYPFTENQEKLVVEQSIHSRTSTKGEKEGYKRSQSKNGCGEKAIAECLQENEHAHLFGNPISLKMFMPIDSEIFTRNIVKVQLLLCY